MTNSAVDKALTDICICTLQVLITLWNLTPLRNSVKKEGWEYTKEIADEYGHAPPTPRPYEDITIPRGIQQAPAASVGRKEPRQVYSDETSLSEIRYEVDPRGPPPKFSNDGYEADDDARRRRAANSGRDEMEMEDIGGYREIDRHSERSGGAQVLPPAYPDAQRPQEEPTYAQVDKSKKKMYKLQGTDGPTTDSWV